MTPLAYKAWQVIRRDFRIDTSYRYTFALELVDGLLMLLAYSFLARAEVAARPDGYAALDFLVIGIAVSGACSTAAICFSQGVRGLQLTGTLKAIIVTPTSATTYLLLSCLYPIARALVDCVLLVSVGRLLGVSFARTNWIGAAIVFGLSLCSMATFGIVAAACAVLFKRGNPATWMLSTVTWLLSGVLYPTSVLPSVLIWVAWMLPTTHALTALRALMLTDASIASVAPHIVFLFVFAAVGLPASLWLFRRAIASAKRAGTLGQV